MRCAKEITGRSLLTPADNWIWEDAEGNLIFEGDSTASYTNADPSNAGEYTLVIEAQSCLSEPTTFELVVTETIQAHSTRSPSKFAKETA